MYLSQLTLNPHCCEALKLMNDAYFAHQTVMRGFPDDLPEAERVLWRIDEGRRNHEPCLLVQSLVTKPDWTALRGYGNGRPLLLACPGNPAVKEISGLSLCRGQNVRFRLVGNPTARRDSRRVPLYDSEDQLAWLERVLARKGFEPLRMRLTRSETVRVRIPRRQSTHQVPLLAVQFDGLLRVVDEAKALAAVRHGVGQGKAFGLGLLSLARGV